MNQLEQARGLLEARRHQDGYAAVVFFRTRFFKFWHPGRKGKNPIKRGWHLYPQSAQVFEWAKGVGFQLINDQTMVHKNPYIHQWIPPDREFGTRPKEYKTISLRGLWGGRFSNEATATRMLEEFLAKLGEQDSSSIQGAGGARHEYEYSANPGGFVAHVDGDSVAVLTQRGRTASNGHMKDFPRRMQNPQTVILYYGDRFGF